MVSLHEVLSFKNTCIVKAAELQPLVNDQKLQKILEQDVAAAKQQLQDIRNVLTATNTIGD